MTDLSIRSDLLAAQDAAWSQVTSPGASWSGAERAAITRVALAAFDDPDPVPPWASPCDAGRELPGRDVLPARVVDVVYRLARHAATVTEEWYRAQADAGIDPVAYVEVVAIVAGVAAVDGFYRAMGLTRPPLPDTVEGPPSGEHPEVEPATLNWVPVAAPADVLPAVVQALSAAPADAANVWRLAAAQYIPVDQMVERAWNRGTLSRAEMELVASRLSAARECFY